MRSIALLHRDTPMPTGIGKSRRRVVHIRIPIQPLHSRRDNGIRLGKPPQGWVIPAGVVEHQPKPIGDRRRRRVVHVGILTREGVTRQLVGRRGGGSGGPRVAEFAPRFIAHFRDFGSVGVGGEARASQVVTEEVFDGHGLGDGVFAHTCTWRKCRCRNASRSSKIILGDGGTCQLVISAHEAGGDEPALSLSKG